MPARVNPLQVGALVLPGEQSAELLLPLQAHIDTAHVMVEANLAGGGLSEAVLAEIEKYLAAHFWAVANPQAESLEAKNFGRSTRVKYRGQTGMGLDFTPFGQQVKLLDPTGRLAGLTRQRASLAVCP